MSNLPEPTTSERLSRIATDQRAVRTQLANLGRLRLHTTSGESEQLVLTAGWQAVEGVPNLWMRPFMPPPSVETDSDHLESRAAYGASCQDASVPQAQRVLVLAGALLWWQTSRGAEPIRLAAGQTVHLAPGELHSWTALEETWCLTCLTPRLCDELPSS